MLILHSCHIVLKKPPFKDLCQVICYGKWSTQYSKEKHMTYYYITQDIPIPQWFCNKTCEWSFVVSRLKEKHMMALHADHEQVITLKRELTCYDYDETLSVSDLDSWYYTSSVTACQYLVIMFSCLTYKYCVPSKHTFSIVHADCDWLMG